MYQRNRPMRSGHFRPRNSSPFKGRRLATFDPSMFVKKAAVEEVLPEYIPQHSFGDFVVCQALQNNIRVHDFQVPTPIQDQAIPVLLQGRDIVGIANTGTGKTAAFLIPLLDKVYKDKTQRVLIVAPTRELAVQIEKEMRLLANQMGIFSAICIGGVSIYGQIGALKRRPNFVIGTPGRLKDLEERGVLHFSDYQSIVLDEVDRMLDMGFIQDVKHIVARLPRVRQSLFFSATMPAKIGEVMQLFLKDPVTLSVRRGESAANVDQDIVKLAGRNKIEVLHELLVQENFRKVLVFGRTKHGINKLEDALVKRGVKVASIHGNKSQGQRQRALEQLKKNSIQVLLATDIASRGLDISDVTHVINYELPESYEDYIHRIGRTGRAGKKGTALTLIE